jgi:thymidylate synthase (FAD)
MTNQIICQINPDVPPTGSDLGIVNAARKSFGRRSEWDDVSYSAMTSLMDTDGVNITDYRFEGYGKSGYYRRLKPKDKRLLEFLIRGMTADDFEKFKESIESSVLGIQDGVPECYEDLVERLWEWRNTPSHDTPVNHSFFSFEVKAPIFVARHLVKHEYLIMSEYSRRYITDDVEFYTPDVWRKAAKDVKQGSSNEEALKGEYFYYEYKEDDAGIPYRWQCGVDTPLEAVIEGYNDRSVGLYQDMVERGVAPEQARMVLPQSLMTSWTWSGTLGAFGNMCKLRLSKDTQYETRLVAEQVYTELKKQFPVAAPMIVEGVF